MVELVLSYENSGGSFDASEIVIYNITKRHNVIEDAKNILKKLAQDLLLYRYRFNYHYNYYTYNEDYVGVLSSLSYLGSGFYENWINGVFDKSELELRIRQFILYNHIVTNSIFSCVCDWPNDVDFLGENFARYTYGIISEFDPMIRDVEDYSTQNWKEMILDLGVQVKDRYGIIKN